MRRFKYWFTILLIIVGATYIWKIHSPLFKPQPFAHMAVCAHSLKQIGLVIHDHYVNHKHYPPTFSHLFKGENPTVKNTDIFWCDVKRNKVLFCTVATENNIPPYPLSSDDLNKFDVYSSYIYLKPPDNIKSNLDEIPIAYDHPKNHALPRNEYEYGVNVLFLDGHVDTIKLNDLEGILKKRKQIIDSFSIKK